MTVSATTKPESPEQDAPAVVPTRHWGRWITGAVGLAILLWVAYKLTHIDKIDYPVITQYLNKSSILEGLKNTILIAVFSQIIGVILGVLLATMRLSKNPVFAGAAWLYIWFFRGTPALVQILFWFNGLLLVITRVRVSIPFTDVVFIDKPAASVITVFVAAVLALGLNEGAYMAEITRAGILSVDQGQTEAAQALGMTSRLSLRRIILPQAMRVIIPPTGNEFISMLKNTALVQVIGQVELLGRATAIYSQSGQVFELLVMTCIWYVLLTSVAQTGQYYLERRFARGSVHQLPPTPLQRVRATVNNLRGGLSRA